LLHETERELRATGAHGTTLGGLSPSAPAVVMRSLIATVASLVALSCAGASQQAAEPRVAGASSAAPGPGPLPTAEGESARPGDAVEEVAVEREAPRVVAPPGTPGWLGVELAKREDGASGVLVRAVLRGSPAERAGLQGGDVVTSVDGQSVGRPMELRDAVAASGAGKRVSLGVLRGDATRLLAAELEPAPNDDEMMRRSYVGARAPDFGALDTVQGAITPTLAGLSGRVVVLEFWASWCGPCHVLAPTLQSWHDRYSAQGVTVLGVTSEPIDVAGRSAGQLGIGYPLARDSSGTMVRAYRAYALPTLFVIDKRGNVRDVLVGYSTPRLREIEALVKKLIAEG
jgi:thiol-disulfide isomerase/thioredoxin